MVLDGRRTGGRRNLDDALVSLWRRHGQSSAGYEDDAVQGEIERAVELDLGPFFDRFVRGREDPDLAAELRAVGYELRHKPEKGDKDRPPDETPPGAWLGAQMKHDAGRLSDGEEERLAIGANCCIRCVCHGRSEIEAVAARGVVGVARMDAR